MFFSFWLEVNCFKVDFWLFERIYSCTQAHIIVAQIIFIALDFQLAYLNFWVLFFIIIFGLFFRELKWKLLLKYLFFYRNRTTQHYRHRASPDCNTVASFDSSSSESRNGLNRWEFLRIFEEIFLNNLFFADITDKLGKIYMSQRQKVVHKIHWDAKKQWIHQ